MKSLIATVLIFFGTQGFAQQTDKEAYIRKESVRGKLDFTKNIEEKYRDKTSVQFGNTTFSKNEYAILLWSANVRTLGINSLDKAVKLWEDINKRSLTEAEKKALKTGFEAEF